MAIQVAAAAAWVAVVERLVALWSRLRGRGRVDASAEPNRPPQATGEARRRRQRPKVKSGVSILVVLCASVVSGCATTGNYDDTLDELVAVCEEVSPCEPCEPCPKCPDVQEPVKEQPIDAAKDEVGCDRDGLPPSSAAVWKPQSDNDGKAAFVTPASATCSRGLTVWYGKKQRRSERWATNGNRANGCRLSWRSTRAPGAAYGDRVRVVCSEEDGTERVWIIPRGAARWEGK